MDENNITHENEDVQDVQNDDVQDTVEESPAPVDAVDETPAEAHDSAPPAGEAPASPAPSEDESEAIHDERMDERLERLGGEPAPVITPEEFARLQKAGQVHIDSRGRVRTSRRNADAGVSLRKRRAWYER